ncbi:hypothetical protein ACLOJK_019182 [Asimina triloba]
MTIKELSRPSSTPTNINIEDYLVDPDANVVWEGPNFGQTGGHDDVETAVPSESSELVSLGGVPFSTPSTTTSRPTMSSSSLLSSS